MASRFLESSSLRSVGRKALCRPSPFILQAGAAPHPGASRHYASTTAQSPPALTGLTASGTSRQTFLRDKYKQYFTVRSPHDTPFDSAAHGPAQVGQTLTLRGFISKIRNKNTTWSYFDLHHPQQSDLLPGKFHTISFRVDRRTAIRQQLQSIPSSSPVAVRGTIAEISEAPGRPWNILLDIQEVHCFNEFPKDIIVSQGVQFPPTARHLQLRFHSELRARLRFRAKVQSILSTVMEEHDFTHFDTPMLFKPTAEGAREFLVPMRQEGNAYALPQSPQQYKQVLMASAFSKYYQWARCFRDEDLRADRQPEFTQLDFEMSFKTGREVMQEIESILVSFFDRLRSSNAAFHLWTDPSQGEAWIPDDGTARQVPEGPGQMKDMPPIRGPFMKLSYQECMDFYGIDKPDLRIPNKICRLDHVLDKNFVSMITKLDHPIVDAWKLRLKGSTSQIRDFVVNFMATLPPSLSQNPDGGPQILVHDFKMPRQGFASLGPEGPEILTTNAADDTGLRELEDGDVVVFQARPNLPHSGGSTKLGELRSLLYHAALSKGLLEKTFGFHFLWVTDFPLFTPSSDSEPGQGGASGFSATHHPFTAPLAEEDFDLLFSDPMRARADHYDLVCNGVELGGGSRRIHVAEIQEFVFRDILQMPEEKIAQFAHLLDALRAGCPPHAGFAFGFDRFVAILTDTPSVRDVIPFPKSMKGEDLFAKSPGRLTDEQLATYHLQRRPKL